MAKTLIISVGGSLEPIKLSIKHHKPEYVCFFVSEESADQLKEIKDEAKRELGLTSKRFRHFVTEDPNDLSSSYKAAKEACNWAKEKIEKEDELIVDYTGGTKVMSAALVLATIDCGCKFSYVSGKMRDKGGLGVVITGSEEVREGPTPWEILNAERRKEFEILFNRYQFSAAIEIGKSLLEKAPKGEEHFLEDLIGLAEGYYLWDIFKHAQALQKIKRAFEGLRGYYKYAQKKATPNFVEEIGKNISFLCRLVKRSDEYERSKALIQDIFNNAMRRKEEGKYDDATLRLYRTLEKVMQVEFKREFGCETGKVNPECLPESIRDKYVSKYLPEGEKELKLPLDATARALREKKNKISEYYFANYEGNFQSLLHTRNNLILAHGDGSVSKEQVEQFSEMVANLLKKFNLYEEIHFPKIRL